MRKTAIILNPAARGDKARDLGAEIASLAAGSATLLHTSGRGEARALAARMVEEGFEQIVAAGGDGTINEIVNALAGADVALGLLPTGTMNVFATELGLSRNLRECWEVIRAGAEREIDLPLANGHAFVQLAGVGFDAQAVQETSAGFKKTFGPLSYLISAAQIAARQPPRLLLQSHAPQAASEGSFVLIGNGRLYGGPFTVFPDARIDDGLLDVLVFKNLGYLDIARYLHGIAFGTHVRLRDVEYFRTAHLSITSDGPLPIPVEVDGEVIGPLPVEFRFHPKRLRVLVPKKKP